MAPTLIASYSVDSGGNNTNTLTTSSFTPSNGEVLIVKGTTWSTGEGLNTPTGGSQTYAQLNLADVGGFTGYAILWGATVSGSPGNMTVSVAPAVSSWHHIVVERWGNAKLAVSPAVNSTLTGNNTTPAQAADITTAATNSIVTWCAVDENSTDPTSRVYLLSATEDGIFDGHIGTNSVQYFAYAQVGAAGTYTMGMSAPTNQHWVLAGVEVQDNSTVSPTVLNLADSGSHPKWLPRVRRGRIIQPVLAQANQGQAWPQWLKPSGFRPRWAPKLRRGRFVEPPWPAFTPPAPVMPNLMGRRSIFRPVRRGKFAEVVPTVVIPQVPYILIGRRPRVGPHSRPHFFHPPWPQGPQLHWTPTVVASRRSITTRLVRRGRRFDPFWPQGRITNRDLILTTGRVTPKWQLGGVVLSTWVLGPADLKWEVGELEVTSISSQSLEYVRVGPVSAQVNGVVVNPTSDVVKMAFLSSTAAPGVSDWQTASWNVVGANQYQIQCLVGPGGTIQLATGSWYVWVQITDSPEIIVRSVDLITVTA
jgi:hypothetical protein